MKKQVFMYNVNKDTLTKTEIKTSKGANYTVKKSKKDKQLKSLIYNEVIYYDIETVTKEESINGIEGKSFKDIEEEREFSALNLDKNIIKSFSILLPKKVVENRYKKNFILPSRTMGKVEMDDQGDYYTLFYYNEDSEKTLKMLGDIFIFINQHRVGTRAKKVKDTTLKICGFNNNSFDDQILEHLKGDNKNFHFSNVYNDSMKKCNVLELIKGRQKPEITNRFLLIDLKNISKQMNLNSLSKVGEDIGIEKLKIENGYKEYNNRDVEVLYHFLHMCNEQLGFYQWNLSSVARKESYQNLCNGLGVEEILSDVKINNFRLIGARTEGFIHHSENVKYVDFTSLYPSAAVKLDMIRPEVYTNDNGKRIASYKLTPVVDTDELKDSIDNIKITGDNVLDLKNLYPLEKFYLMKVKLTGIKPEYKNEILHIFPFSFKDEEIGKVNFQYKQGGVYEVGFYEVLFLSFFEFEFVSCFTFKKGPDILKGYKEELYRKRNELKKKKDPKERFYKILLNAGYGIFASNVRNERILDIKLKEKIIEFEQHGYNLDYFVFNQKKQLFKVKKIGNEHYKENINPNQQWNSNTVPVYALNITSNARSLMYSVFFYLMTKGSISGLMYSDTDSIILSQENYNLLEEVGIISNKGLGYMTDEEPDNEILEMKVFAPKTYEMKLKIGKDTDKYKKGDIVTKRIFKGTGNTVYRKVFTGGIGKTFNIIEREALKPKEIQKRILKGNIFVNKYGYSEDLEKVWNEYSEEQLELMKENKPNDYNFYNTYKENENDILKGL